MNALGAENILASDGHIQKYFFFPVDLVVYEPKTIRTKINIFRNYFDPLNFSKNSDLMPGKNLVYIPHIIALFFFPIISLAEDILYLNILSFHHHSYSSFLIT